MPKNNTRLKRNQSSKQIDSISSVLSPSTKIQVTAEIPQSKTSKTKDIEENLEHPDESLDDDGQCTTGDEIRK